MSPEPDRDTPRREPTFDVYIDEGEHARFRLKGSNGEPMLASESYSSESNARRGVADAQVAVLQTLEDELTAALEALPADTPTGLDAARFVIAHVRELLQ